MTVSILSIGTEIVRGEIVNTNASYLADALTTMGLEVGEVTAVADVPERLIATLIRLGRDHDQVIATGGLGPTTDDITTDCVARALGVPLVRDAASLEAVRVRLARYGRELSVSNAKQADFPLGASVLPNPHGTAPGFAVVIDRALACFMPGVPGEMRPMFETEVAPRLPRVRRSHQIILRAFGGAESAINDRLAGIETRHGVVLGYRAHLPEIEVKVLARSDDETAAARIARGAADEVIARLGADLVYGEGTVALPEVVGRLLHARGLTLALAESCTGGLVAELVTDAPGATAFFLGGAVTYADAAKSELLGVDPALIDRHGAVSAEVARAMAEGARARLRADVALAITGIAGPTGGTPEKPVGLVHFAVARSAGTVDRRLQHPGPRAAVRRRAAYAGLMLVREVLLRQGA